LEADPSISSGMGNAEKSPYECNYPCNGLEPSFHQSELFMLTL